MSDVRLVFFELVLRPCVRRYGVAPCRARLGVTGDVKCYNSPATCQSVEDFLAGEQVVRWAVPTEDLPLDVDCVPSIESASVRAQKINAGESLGTRESLTVSFFNHRHNDVGFDFYPESRGFNAYNSGTFWGKFSARWPHIAGFECRYVLGFVGQALDDMERRYYVVDSTRGVDNGGGFSIIAKDAIKFLDGDKSVAPLPSMGVLKNAIDKTATSLVLDPLGVGDAYYPVTGFASMGDEMVSFTRAGDVVQFTGRALNGSVLGDHDKDETFQLGLVFDAVETSDIIFTLLNDFTDTPTEYLDVAAWRAETQTHIGRLYSAAIMKPTSVKTLIDELIQQVGLVVYTNTNTKKIVLKALRHLVPTLSLSDDRVLENSITSTTESDKRLSSILLFYAQKNPLEKINDEKNYRGILNTVSGNPVAALEQASESIKKIYSRWISVINRPAAEAVSQYLLKRYERAPRAVGFKLPHTIPLELGSVFTLQSRLFEDAQGQMISMAFQAVSVEPTGVGLTVMGESLPQGANAVGTEAVVTIDNNALNINLRALYDTIYLSPKVGDVVRFVIGAGVIVGGAIAGAFSVEVGNWPLGIQLVIEGQGRIQGKGGWGGVTPTAGSPALRTRYPIVIGKDLVIWGGGGGGGGFVIYPQGGQTSPTVGFGGFGQGYLSTADATSEAAGLQHDAHAGAGGAAGEKGGDAIQPNANISHEGAAGGAAIDGASFVSFEQVGNDIRGALIN